MLVEMLEELLGAGFPVETALSMINTALVMGREEVRFSTVDMSIFDLYNGKCEFVKAGAAVTFLRTKDGVEHIRSESLPLGVIQRQQVKRKPDSWNPEMWWSWYRTGFWMRFRQESRSIYWI